MASTHRRETIWQTDDTPRRAVMPRRARSPIVLVFPGL
jgi:hypothetical protein